MIEAGRVEEKLAEFVGRVGQYFLPGGTVTAGPQVRARIDERPAPQELLDPGRVCRRPQRQPAVIAIRVALQQFMNQQPEPIGQTSLPLIRATAHTCRKEIQNCQ
jgi:hypothetical protein